MRTRLHKISSILLALLVLSLSILTSIYLVHADSVRHPKVTSLALSLERQNSLRDYIIYEDSLAPGWKNCSWGSKINFANTSPRYSGERSISFAATRSRGALCLYTKTAIHTTSYAYLHFAAQASRAGQEYKIGLYESSNHQRADVQPATFNINPPAGTWKMYTIPLLDLSAHSTNVRGVVVQSRAAFSQPALYIDTVGITDVVSPLPTPTPSPTPIPSPTSTLSPTATPSPTSTLSPTATPTLTPTAAPRPTPTLSPTPTPSPTPPPAGAKCQGMSIAAYFTPGKWWNMMSASYPATRLVIANANSGPGSSQNSALMNAINNMKQAGIRVFGYVYTSQGTRDPASIKADIDQWRALYNVTDIMFDEALIMMKNFSFYKDIADYVHTKTPGSLVEMNPGAPVLYSEPINEAYMQIADIIAMYEGPYSLYQNFQPPSWITKYPPTRFKNYIYSAPDSSVISGLLQQIIKNNMGYFDITDSNNPWGELASDAFWNALAPAVKSACQ